MALTRDMGAVLELLIHLSVHLYHHVSFLRHQLVPILDLRTNPLLEWVADDRRADIDDPLLGRLYQINVVGEEVSDVGLVRYEVQYLLDREALVLRHMELLDLVVHQVSLLLVEDVLQEVDGRVVYIEEGLSQGKVRDLP